jgi:rubrerythrin
MDENSSGDDPDVIPALDNRTRRAFFGATATLGAAAIAGCSADTGDDLPVNGTADGSPASPAGTTVGPRDTDEPTDAFTETDTETATATETPTSPDVSVLNYALTLEHLEYAFYRDGIDRFGDAQLRHANVLSNVDESLRREIPDRLAAIRDHERAHVDALSATIDALQETADSPVTPVEEAEYDFGYETPSEFIQTGQVLENTGVAAYAGVAPRIVDNDVLAAAAGIHSVEARHAGYLNLLNLESPFPDAFDESMTVDEVLNAAGGFVTSDLDRSAFPGATDSSGQQGPAAPGDGSTASRRTPARRQRDDTSDVTVLNYALTLEHLEYALYREALSRFSDRDIQNASVLLDYSQRLRRSVPDRLVAIRDHEREHVEALTGAVESAGGTGTAMDAGTPTDRGQNRDAQNGQTPVRERNYDFDYETPSEFLELARQLENTGVAAYKGAVTTVSADQILEPALSIHSVEARHAGYLNLLTGRSPFPQAVDEPLSMAEVQSAIQPFLQPGTRTP